MADSQATTANSSSTASCWEVSNKTYSASNKCDGDRNGYLDLSDTEQSQAHEVLLQETNVLADQHVLHFSDNSDTE